MKLKSAKKNPQKRNKLVFFIIPALVVICCGLVSRFAFQVAVVNGDSMNPAYHNFQFVLVDRRDRKFSDGDVVAIKIANGKSVIKRVAAKPNETIIIADRKVIVNGKTSKLYADKTVDFSGIAGNEIQLKDNEYFVLGDNLQESRDSRYSDVGIIKEENIIGKVLPQIK